MNKQKLIYQIRADKIPPRGENPQADALRNAIKEGITLGWVEKYTPPTPKELKKTKSSEQIDNIMATLGSLYNRRPTTKWSIAEVKAYKAANIDPDDLEMVIRYYSELSQKPKEEDIRRRDLLTLLNNWHGEVDRARTYKYPARIQKKMEVQPYLDTPPEGWLEWALSKYGDRVERDWSKITKLVKIDLIDEMKEDGLI